MTGMDFEQLVEKFMQYLCQNSFDKVILTQFETPSYHNPLQDYGYAPIRCFIDEVHEYGYGWDRQIIDDMLDHNPNLNYCEGGTHSEYVIIDDWMKDLKGEEVFISGAFNGECIEDLEIALNGAEVEFSRIEELII